MSLLIEERIFGFFKVVFFEKVFIELRINLLGFCEFYIEIIFEVITKNLFKLPHFKIISK
jgi:hypothetical protein